MIQAAYVSYIKDMFVLTGDDSITASTKANSIFDLEKSTCHCADESCGNARSIEDLQ